MAAAKKGNIVKRLLAIRMLIFAQSSPSCLVCHRLRLFFRRLCALRTNHKFNLNKKMLMISEFVLSNIRERERVFVDLREC